jgi:hypothetical protein
MSDSTHPALDSGWQYRVMEFTDGDETWREIREVYYRHGRPDYYASESASPYWFPHQGPDAALHVVERMREALGGPVLRPGDFAEGKNDHDCPAVEAQRVLHVAAVTGQVTDVFGNGAAWWQATPEPGFAGQRPVELLRCSEGADLVDAFLTRIDNGTDA